MRCLREREIPTEKDESNGERIALRIKVSTLGALSRKTETKWKQLIEMRPEGRIVSIRLEFREGDVNGVELGEERLSS